MARSKSLRFICPHCGIRLKKSLIAQNLGRAANPMEFAPPSTPCPSCRKPIDTQRMLAGDYDELELGPLGILALVALLFGTPWVLFKYAGLNFWVSIGIAYGVLIIGSQLLRAMFRRKRAQGR